MLDAYFVNNLHITCSFNTLYIREIRLSLMVNNLLNTKYETNAWVYRYVEGGAEKAMDGYFPQAGIHFLAGVNLKF
jgi:iron complex outermembrane receptor protein